jgi:hypothetical protein
LSARVHVHLALTKGGSADITDVDGERVALLSTVSSPPGSTLDGALDDGTPIRIKVRGCRKEDERYRIDGRIIDLSRALRERLNASG